MNISRNSRSWCLVFFLFSMESPASAGTLIKAYGHFHVFWTAWTIDVSEYGMTFGVKTDQGTEIKDPDPEWKPHSGWFGYVENKQAWAYDGADTASAQVVGPTQIYGYRFEPHQYMADTWGLIPNPPKDVFDRLSPKIKALILQKFPSGH